MDIKKNTVYGLESMQSCAKTVSTEFKIIKVFLSLG